MRRRDFIIVTLGGAAAVSATGLSRAQQKAKIYRIAVVHPALPVGDLTETGTSRSGAYPAFFQRLRELGYVEGRNLSIEPYSAEGREDHFAELAAQVVRSNPDLIFVASTRLTLDFKAATEIIPIVANVADPVVNGLVPSLARPGGNITGTTSDAGVEITGKRLGLLHELLPGLSSVAYLASRRVWQSPDGAAAQQAARSIGISLVGPPLEAPFEEAEYRRVLAAMKQEGVDALIVGDQAENAANARLIVELTEKTRLLTIYAYPFIVRLGGLIAYGIDFRDVFRRAADQVDQILKGTKPSDIPFYEPTKFVLAINRKAANALGLTVPDSLLAQADEVIE